MAVHDPDAHGLAGARPRGRRVAGRIGVILLAIVIVALGVAAAIGAFVLTARIHPNRFAMYAAAVLAGIAVSYGLSLIALRGTRRRRDQTSSWERRTQTSTVIAGANAALLVAVTIALNVPLLPVPAPTPEDGEAAPQYADLSTGSRIAWWKTPAASPSGEPPVIFLHGGPGASVRGTMELFDALAEDAGRDVYYFDQIGAGYSDLLEADEYSIERLLDDLEAFRTDVVGSDRVALLGHSFGGFYAEAYATTHPEAVDKVALVTPLNYSVGDLTDEEAEAVERPTRPEDEGEDADAPAPMPVDPFPMTKLTLANMLGEQTSWTAAAEFMSQREQSSVVSALLGADESLINPVANIGVDQSSHRIVDEVMDDLATTALPTLIVRNEYDYILWPALRLYRDLNPNATLAYVPDADHEDIEKEDTTVYEPVRAFFADEEIPGVYEGEEDPHFFFGGQD